jgi:hypothetical protein
MAALGCVVERHSIEKQTNRIRVARLLARENHEIETRQRLSRRSWELNLLRSWDDANLVDCEHVCDRATKAGL